MSIIRDLGIGTEINVSNADLVADYVPDGSGRYQIYRAEEFLVTRINGGSEANGEEFAERLERAPQFDAHEARAESMLSERFGSSMDVPTGEERNVVWIDGEAYLVDWADGVVAISVEIPAPTDADVDAAVDLAKREILADIGRAVSSRGDTMPATVSSFSELHDYVDANEYGGLCAGFIDWIGPDGEHLDMSIRVQDAVDAWLRAGRPTD
jgi:hypothetical protein